ANVLRRTLGIAAAIAIGGTLALHAQERPKPAGKAVAPQAQPATQGSKTTSPQPEAHGSGTPEQTTSSLSTIGGNWRVECSTEGQVLDCLAVQRVVTRENQQLVAGLTVRLPAANKPVMMVQMPLGVLITEGVELSIDDNKSERFNIQTCNQQGCFVGAPLTEGLLASMRSGKQLRIVFKSANAQSVTVTLPLAGFALAYDKIKS